MVRQGLVWLTLVVCASSSCKAFEFVPLPPEGVVPAHVAAATSCALLSRCFNFNDGANRGVDACVDVVLGRSGVPGLEPFVVQACVKAAEDCATMGRCINAGHQTVSCDPTVTERACAGTVGQRCVGVVVSLDCADLGMACVEDRVGDFYCGQSGGCGENRCEGNGALNCLNAVMVYHDCGPGSCIMRDGRAHCAGEGDPCDDHEFRCDGNVAVSCLEGRLHRERCAKCSAEDGAFCVSAERCHSSVCDGDLLLACIDGKIHEVDCVGLGMTTCQSGQGARCVD